METRRTLLVDAFTNEPLAGNVAGVVPDADGLDENRMQRIAAELGASETAFFTGLSANTEADRRVRYFTPTTEVDLCGHATIAGYAALLETGTVEAGEDVLRTNVGDLLIIVTDSGTIWMRQDVPTIRAVDIDLLEIADALGIDPAALRDVGADLPIMASSTGLSFLCVPVNFLERLGEASPDMDAVTAISAAHDVAGVYAFTFDTLDANATVHGCAFVPTLGIEEDPVTGTASGACAAYLDHVDAFDDDFPNELRFEQGHFRDRPGLVRVQVADDDVRVGGDAVVSLRGELSVPDRADDEIIEI